MKRTLFVALIMGLVSGLVQAAPVSESAARLIAAQFMAKKKLGTISTATPRMLRGKATSQPALYVFNTEKAGCGWVIVSGDDRTQQVLGYSDTGTYDENNVPENMQWWLSQYVEEIASLDDSDSDGLSVLDDSDYDASPKTAAVSPLIQTKWNQGRPYYFQCPTINSQYCVTGCVATAMAQIMYYHQWPDMTSRGIPAYYWKNEEATLSSLAGTTFNWSAMKTTYSSSDTDPNEDANSAVARLMRYCGQSVEMNYGVNSSGTNSQSEVFNEYFKYSTKARKLFRFDYPYSQWENYILKELQANRPVLYGGRKYNGGHAFVCDGYDGNGYYHFNWGWSGNGDGYFLLTSLNPDASGIGSAVGNNGYTIRNYIIIGLEPNTVSTSERNSVIYANNVNVNNVTYTRNSSSDPFVITIRCNYHNGSYVSRDYDMSWGIYNSTGFYCIATYGNPHNATLDAGNGTEPITRVLNFGKDYGNGTYYLRPICRESGSNQWLPCHESGLNYIKAVINGNTLTLTPVDKGDEIDQTTEGVSASFFNYSTFKKINRPLDVRVKVTKTCLADNFYFYLWANDKLVGANALTLDGNSSDYVTISYTPTESGTNNLKLTADMSGNNLYCTGSVEVDTLTDANISISYYVPGCNSSNNYTLFSTELPFRLTIKNNLSTTYHDYIVARLYKKESDGSSTLIKKDYVVYYIPGNETIEWFHFFTDLEPGDYYAQFYYYYYDTQILRLRTIIYHVKARGDVNGDGTVTAADVTALYDYLLNNNSSHIVNGDQTGDGIITAADVTAVYDVLLGN